jgi:hypothetical protein
VATLLTPDDILGSASHSASTTLLWDSPGRRGVRTLGSSIHWQAEDHFGLKCGVANDGKRRYGTAALAILLVGLVCWAATKWIPHPAVSIGAVAGPVDGLTIFAVFFVAALAIERLLEPLSNAMLPRAELASNAHQAWTHAGRVASHYVDHASEQAGGDEDNSGGDDNTTTPKGAVPTPVTETTVRSARAEPPENDNEDPAAKTANDAIQRAAVATEALSVRGLQRATAFWALATCLGMLVAAAMNLYFMKTVGITVGYPWEEILATGLIIGGGTKPLHDLVKLISTTSAGAGGDSG